MKKIFNSKVFMCIAALFAVVFVSTDLSAMVSSLEIASVISPLELISVGSLAVAPLAIVKSPESGNINKAIALNSGMPVYRNPVRAGHERPNGEIRFSVKNTHEATKRLAICPGMFPTVAEMQAYGIDVDAIIGDGYVDGGDVDNGIFVESLKSGLKVNQFLYDMKNNNFNLNEILIETDKEAVFSHIVDYGEVTSINKSTENDINLNKYISAFQTNGKKATIDLVQDGIVKQLNANRFMIWPIPANTEIFFSMKVDLYLRIFG